MSSGITYIQSYETILDTAGGGLPAMVASYNTYVLPLAAAIGAVYIMIQGIKIVADPGAGKVDFNTLVKPILILAVLVLYNDIMGIMDDLFDILTSIYEIPPSQLDNTTTTMGETQDTGGPDGGGIYDIVQINPFFEFIHMVVFFFASAVGFFMLCRQLVAIKMLYLIGPLALTFSMVPGNFGTLQKWWASYMSVSLWKPIYYIMMALLEHVSSLNGTSGFAIEDILFTFAFQLVMVWTVLEIPEYAYFLVSSDAPYRGGQAVEKVYGQGAAVGANALNYGKKAATGVLGGIGNVGARAVGTIKRTGVGGSSSNNNNDIKK